MTTMFQDLVKCAVCGKGSGHKFNGSTKAFGDIYLDTDPDKMELSALPYLIQRCPSCGYCSYKLSELINDADKQIESEEYKDQLTNEKFPELANSFLCAGLLHEYMEEYDKAGWDCLYAAKVCDDKKDSEASSYCRKRALAMVEEAMESGQRFMNNASKERLLLTDIARRAELFETVEENWGFQTLL